MSITIQTDNGPVYFITNHRPRPVRCWAELEHTVIAEWFGEDYSITDDEKYTPRFVEYLGAWYDLNDGFELGPDYMRDRGFDGCQTDSYFSATVCKWFDADGNYMPSDGEVVMGRSHW